MFPAAMAATFQTTVDETGWPWDNVGERYQLTYLAVTAVDAGTYFKSDLKFATVVPAKMTYFIEAVKQGERNETWQYVTDLNKLGQCP